MSACSMLFRTRKCFQKSHQEFIHFKFQQSKLVKIIMVLGVYSARKWLSALVLIETCFGGWQRHDVFENTMSENMVFLEFLRTKIQSKKTARNIAAKRLWPFKSPLSTFVAPHRLLNCRAATVQQCSALHIVAKLTLIYLKRNHLGDRNRGLVLPKQQRRETSCRLPVAWNEKTAATVQRLKP